MHLLQVWFIGVHHVAGFIFGDMNVLAQLFWNTKVAQTVKHVVGRRDRVAPTNQAQQLQMRIANHGARNIISDRCVVIAAAVIPSTN